MSKPSSQDKKYRGESNNRGVRVHEVRYRNQNPTSRDLDIATANCPTSTWGSRLSMQPAQHQRLRHLPPPNHLPMATSTSLRVRNPNAVFLTKAKPCVASCLLVGSCPNYQRQILHQHQKSPRSPSRPLQMPPPSFSYPSEQH